MSDTETSGSGERAGSVAAEGAAGGSGGGAELPVSEARDGREGAARATRPLVLPKTFDGSGSLRDWIFHFDNVASVNGWDDTQKLKWLRVCMTGRAQKALHRLPPTATATFESTREARFDHESRYTRFQAEFQARRKKATEGWADLADDLRSLADKAYPTLQEEARERLALNTYLAQLPQPQVSFSVRQKQPSTLDEAIALTVEMESYMSPQASAGVSSTLPAEDGSGPGPVSVDAVDRYRVGQLTQIVERLTEQVEKLQRMTGERQQATRRARRGFTGECWNCQQIYHTSRNCPLRQKQGLGN